MKKINRLLAPFGLMMSKAPALLEQGESGLPDNLTERVPLTPSGSRPEGDLYEVFSCVEMVYDDVLLII